MKQTPMQTQILPIAMDDIVPEGTEQLGMRPPDQSRVLYRSVVGELVGNAAVGTVDAVKDNIIDRTISCVEIFLRESDIDRAAEQKRYFDIVAKPDCPVRRGAEIRVELLVEEAPLRIEEITEDVFAE